MSTALPHAPTAHAPYVQPGSLSDERLRAEALHRLGPARTLCSLPWWLLRAVLWGAGMAFVVWLVTAAVGGLTMFLLFRVVGETVAGYLGAVLGVLSLLAILATWLGTTAKELWSTPTELGPRGLSFGLLRQLPWHRIERVERATVTEKRVSYHGAGRVRIKRTRHVPVPVLRFVLRGAGKVDVKLQISQITADLAYANLAQSLAGWTGDDVGRERLQRLLATSPH